jgi:hypothetical protein
LHYRNRLPRSTSVWFGSGSNWRSCLESDEEKPCSKDLTRPCTIEQNSGRCSTLLFIRSFLDSVDNFVFDRSPKEIIDHVTNTLVEFVDLDSRRESSVYCCTENHNIMWVEPSILLRTSWTFLCLVIVNVVIRHRSPNRRRTFCHCNCELPHHTVTPHRTTVTLSSKTTNTVVYYGFFASVTGHHSSENRYLHCGDIWWNKSVWTHVCRHIGPRRDVKQRKLFT